MFFGLFLYIFKNMKTYILILLYFFTCEAHALKLEKSTMNISGRASMPMSINRHDEFHLSLDLAPRFGIFLIDNLEFGTEIFTQINYIHNQQEKQVSTPIKWGVASEVVYYFDTPTIIKPYLGAGLGMRITDWNILTISLTYKIPLGMLIALEKNFALDVGLAFTGFSSFRSLGEKFEISPGFLGFRYFF